MDAILLKWKPNCCFNHTFEAKLLMFMNAKCLINGSVSYTYYNIKLQKQKK